MKRRKLIMALLALALPWTMSAQYTIYPVPQSQTAGTATVSFTPTVTIVSEPGIDDYTVQRAKSIFAAHNITAETATEASATNANVYLGIAGATGAAHTQAESLGLSLSVLTTADKFDRHVLSLSDGGDGRAQLIVIGENTDATFIGLASLEQMLDGGTENLAAVTINDYADQQNRGIVEGFYGLPYSVEAKKDIIRFMMRYKMNTYLYGAKCDPYHSTYWKDAYPVSLTSQQASMGILTQSDIKDIVSTAHESKVNFIWAIHPGNNLVNSSTVSDDIISKYAKMYELGVRQFAIFADDVSVPSTTEDMQATADHITAVQKAMEEKWNKTYATPADTVRPLHFVPQIYCRSFASSEEQFNNFFQALASVPEQVVVYTTGYGVWSVPNDGDLNLTQNQLGRNVAWWWNYPCNDNGIGRSQLYTMDMYENFKDMPNVGSSSTLPNQITASNRGILSNPMTQGTAAKLPVFSVADYTWNNQGFVEKTSWEAAFKGILPGNAEAQAAYRYLAPYLRYYESSSVNSLISSFKSSKNATALLELMTNIETNCNTLLALKDSETESERLLYDDIHTWTEKLHDMAASARELLTLASKSANTDDDWATYMTQRSVVDGLSTDTKYFTTRLSGFGGTTLSTEPELSNPANQYLLPFLTDYLKAHALDGLFATSDAQTAPEGFTNVEGAKVNVKSASGNGYTLATSKAVTLQKGQFIGVKLPKPILLASITIADTLLSNHTVLSSADGKNWQRITAAKTEPDDYIRYVVVANDSDKATSLRLRVSSMKIVYPSGPTVSETTVPEGTFWQNHTADLITDGNYSTYVCLQKVIEKYDAYTLKLAEPTTIRRVRICMNTTNNDYMDKALVQVSADGKKWNSLYVLGTKTLEYTLSLAANKQVATNVMACDFDGANREAQYVRLYVTGAPENKWLRLAEIEVNGEESFSRDRLTDNAGLPVSEATDLDASTSTASNNIGKTDKEYIYYLYNYSLVNNVKLYCDPATIDNIAFATTTDQTTWTDADFTSTAGVITVPFADEARSATAMRITWTGTTPPDIYEIVENADEAASPVVSRVEHITLDGTNTDALNLKINNGRISAHSVRGIASVAVYTADGRTLLTHHTGGSHDISLPRLTTARGTLIVRISLVDGTSRTFKVQ